MTNDNDTQRRWLPWSREKDTKAQLVAAVLGLLTAVVISGTGYLRVDKFGYSDFVREIKTERLITEAQIAQAISIHRKDCGNTHERIEKRFDLIERFDDEIASNAKTCRELLVQLRQDHRALSKIVHDFQRRK